MAKNRKRDEKDLQKKWDRILAETGFEDIEKEIGGERVLKQSADYAFRRAEHTATYREAKLDYFCLISAKLHTTQFDDSSDRLIMERTAEGRSIQEISAELKDLGWRKHNRDTIRYIRRRYEARWGIRSWKEEECVSRKVLTQSSRSPQISFPFLMKVLLKRNLRGA
jgi:hypothetical protein